MHRNKSDEDELETQLTLNFSLIATPNFGSATINESELFTCDLITFKNQCINIEYF